MALSNRDVEIAADLSTLKAQNKTLFEKSKEIKDGQKEILTLLKGDDDGKPGFVGRLYTLEQAENRRSWAFKALGVSTIALIGRAIWNSISKN